MDKLVNRNKKIEVFVFVSEKKKREVRNKNLYDCLATKPPNFSLRLMKYSILLSCYRSKIKVYTLEANSSILGRRHHNL